MSVKKIFKVGEVVDDVQGLGRTAGRFFKGRRNTTVVPKKGGQTKKPVVSKNKGSQTKEPVAPKPKIKEETLSPQEKKIKAEVGADPSNAGARAKKTILDKRNEPARRYLDTKSAAAESRKNIGAAKAAGVALIGATGKTVYDFSKRVERRIQEEAAKQEAAKQEEMNKKSEPSNKKTKTGIEDRDAAAILDAQPKRKTGARLDPSIALGGRPKDESKDKPEVETKASRNETPKATPVVSPALFRKTMGTSLDPKSKMDRDKMKDLEEFVAGNDSLKGKTDTQIALAYYRRLKK